MTPEALNEETEFVHADDFTESMMHVEKHQHYVSAIEQDGKRRAARAFECMMNSAKARCNVIMAAERRKGEALKPEVRKRILLSKADMAEKAFPHLSIAAIYRRYRQVYLLALEDVVLILLDSTSIEEAHEKVIAKIKEFGRHQSQEIRQHHSKLLNPTVKVGED